jgi:4-diphosphocytidyl-2-C-methyl-D-erythritol kinase
MIETPCALRDCPAPAKLNLFLHITGRRADGYHDLQTVFQLLDWHDTLHFTRREDGMVSRTTSVCGVPEANDLTVRAARALQKATGTAFGVDIEIKKRLPMGGGLGGGSSDAATTLLALNRLWALDLSREALQRIALPLGADVPFFVFGRNAFAEGVGEALSALALPPRHYLVVTPDAHVPTAEIFADLGLTRDTPRIKIADFLGQQNISAFGRNDMQPVVVKKYAKVAQVLEWLQGIAPARMTGSGASVFAVFGCRAEAEAALAGLPSEWAAVIAQGLQKHPLCDFAS